ncbi:DUF6415 family natural product biosynthesis protein [Streptomyces sp. NBC_00371]|uniref:DUF6415 family natural product biosynthesis protein n=1 Tax=unclassified Streptomyces TaxID=2593676 RepID=UPI002E266593|nr:MULTISPECIES: DUF6415 family natural product biosynthesis protein [unclassified Streptomyces]
MSSPRGTALPTPTICEVIEEALSAPRDYPTPERLRYLYAAARLAIQRLTPIVAAQVEDAAPGPERASRERAVDEAEAVMREGLSPSPLAASLTISALGRALWGLHQITGDDR